MVRRLLSGAALLVCVACNAALPDSPVEETSHASTDAIVGGSLSGAEHDAVVQLARDGQLSCTGTLIAPNLLLTARHCVAGQAPQNATDECVLGATLPASSFSVKLGAAVQNDGEIMTPDARGLRVFTATGSPTICGFDVALIQLDRKIPNAKIAKVRLTPLTKGEKGFTAVGYGVNGRTDALPSARLQRTNLVIEAVGPVNTTFTRRTGERVAYDVPANDFTTGESTCNGDSGGPLFDASMRIVGVTSRGLPVENSCLDLPAFYGGLAGNADIVRRAATAAGVELDEGTTEPESATEEPDDDTETAPKKTSKKKKPAEDEDEDEDSDTTALPTQTYGCTVAHGPATSHAGVVLGLALLVAATRRRRR